MAPLIRLLLREGHLRRTAGPSNLIWISLSATAPPSHLSTARGLGICCGRGDRGLCRATGQRGDVAPSNQVGSPWIVPAHAPPVDKFAGSNFLRPPQGEPAAAGRRTSSQKGPALLPPYTTGMVRIRFQSRHKAGAGNRRVAMASCRSKVRVAVRALVKRRERPRRRIRRRTLSAHR